MLQPNLVIGGAILFGVRIIWSTCDRWDFDQRYRSEIGQRCFRVRNVVNVRDIHISLSQDESIHSDDGTLQNTCLICCQTMEGTFAFVPCGHANLCRYCRHTFITEICTVPFAVVRYRDYYSFSNNNLGITFILLISLHCYFISFTLHCL